MKHLFLSPHFDDAIYSCGGTIYDFTQQGDEVTILTLMAGEPTFPLPDTPVLKDNHTRWEVGDNPIIARKQEDVTSAKIVGATTLYADLADCIYRVVDGKALYATEQSLWKNIHPQDPAINRLHHLELPDFDILYAPLGVGEHVDHLIIRDWAWQLAQRQELSVKFYVEYPYLRHKSAVKQAYEVFPTVLESFKQQLSQAAMHHKIQAMAAYRSQIKSFWDNADEIADEVRQTFTQNGQYVEEYAEPKFP